MCTVPIRPDSKDEIANRSYSWPYPEMYPYVVEDKEPSHYVLNYNETRGCARRFQVFSPVGTAVTSTAADLKKQGSGFIKGVSTSPQCSTGREV